MEVSQAVYPASSTWRLLMGLAVLGVMIVKDLDKLLAQSVEGDKG